MIIFLHGYGADGADLFGLSEPFSNKMPNTQFISPDAPHDCGMSLTGKEWFPIEKIPFGAKDAVNDFLIFLENESKSFSVPFENIILIGFSQGALVCYNFICKLEKPLGAIFPIYGLLRFEKNYQSDRFYFK